jgi:predicted amidohydrolase
MGQDGAELLVVISASPTRVDAREKGYRAIAIWSDLLRAHAVLHGMHVVFVNRVGFEDGVSFWGGSCIIAPDGRVVAQAPLFDESLTIAEIDRRDVLRERMRSHHVWDEDPELTLRALGGALWRRRLAETRMGGER